MKKKSENPQFQNTAEVFNQWAKSGRDKGMELGHQFAVLEALKQVEFKAGHAFLDIGCGNGWLVREVASRQKYSLGIGIDASREMVKKARGMTALDNIQFICTDILSWNTDFRFDTIVSMEAFYYVKPMEKIFDKIKEIILPGGILLVGADNYAENPGSAGWSRELDLPMDRRSMQQWKDLFSGAGFSDIRQFRIRYPQEADVPPWKKEFGSLFAIGTFSGR